MARVCLSLFMLPRTLTMKPRRHFISYRVAYRSPQIHIVLTEQYPLFRSDFKPRFARATFRQSKKNNPRRSYTYMSRVTGLRYAGIHDTPEAFLGSTPDRCFRSLYTGNCGFRICYTPDIPGAISVVSCTRKIFQSFNTRRFEVAISGNWDIHRTNEGIAAIFM